MIEFLRVPLNKEADRTHWACITGTNLGHTLINLFQFYSNNFNCYQPWTYSINLFQLYSNIFNCYQPWTYSINLFQFYSNNFIRWKESLEILKHCSLLSPCSTSHAKIRRNTSQKSKLAIMSCTQIHWSIP